MYSFHLLPPLRQVAFLKTQRQKLLRVFYRDISNRTEIVNGKSKYGIFIGCSLVDLGAVECCGSSGGAIECSGPLATCFSFGITRVCRGMWKWVSAQSLRMFRMCYLSSIIVKYCCG